MNRNSLSLRLYIIIILIAGIFHCEASAKSDKSDGALAYASDVARSYQPWSALSIDGKIDIDGIPLRPSVKIYMKRGEMISIIIRAPFLGEVGRVEIEGDRVTAINKLKKVYCSESASSLPVAIPLTVGDIQDMLLARVFIAGSGTLSASNLRECEIVEYDSDNWFIVPPAIKGSINAEYGFNLDSEGKLRLLFATDDTETLSVSAEYFYEKKKTQIELLLNRGTRQYSAGLELGKPDSNASRPAPINTASGYRQVSLKDFLKSF